MDVYVVYKAIFWDLYGKAKYLYGIYSTYENAVEAIKNYKCDFSSLIESYQYEGDEIYIRHFENPHKNPELVSLELYVYNCTIKLDRPA